MLIVLIVFLSCVIIYISSHIIKGYKSVFALSHPEKSETLDLSSIPYPFTTFNFFSKDGLKISAIQYIPKQRHKGTIIACHYLSGSKTSIYPYIEPLLEKGFAVVSFDYPNHGESMSRKSNKYTLEDDMRRFIIKLKELGIDGPYGTFGFSMGATLAFSATDFLPEIKAIAVDGGPLIFVKDYFLYVLTQKNIKNKVERIIFLFLYLFIIGFYKMKRKMVRRLKKLNELPVMVIHGKRDTIISHRNAEFAYSLIKSEKSEFISVEKAHHLTNRVLLGEEYDIKITSFFEKWLTENGQT